MAADRRALRLVVPAVIAVLALGVGGYFAWLTWLKPAAADTSSTSIGSHLLRLPRQGFSVRVPSGLVGTRVRGHAYLTDRKRSVAIVVGRSGSGTLRATNRSVIAQMRSTYRTVHVVGSTRQRVHGLRGLTTHGTAVNKRGAHLRFVQLSLAGPHVNYTISAYAAGNSSPAYVVPRLNLVANSFRILKPPKPPKRSKPHRAGH